MNSLCNAILVFIINHIHIDTTNDVSYIQNQAHLGILAENLPAGQRGEGGGHHQGAVLIQVEEKWAGAWVLLITITATIAALSNTRLVLLVHGHLAQADVGEGVVPQHSGQHLRRKVLLTRGCITYLALTCALTGVSIT